MPETTRTASAQPAPPAPPNAVEMSIDGIRTPADAPHRTVILKEKGGPRSVQIQIGPPEAHSIALKLRGEEVPRPLTHDLLLSGFDALGGRVTHVLVNELRAETFYARISLDVHGREVALDARPSDALALAVRASVPIYAAEQVLEQAATASQEAGEPDARRQRLEALAEET